MDTEWSLRPAQDSDAEALALVGAATFLESFAQRIDGPDIIAHCASAHSAQTYRGYLANGGKAWLAETRPWQAPVGYALVTAPDLPGMEDGDAELKRIYALAPWHGTGLGGALLDAAIAGSAGHRRLLLGVYRHNERALAFYAKHGFVPIAERIFRVGSKDHDDLVLARPLSAPIESTP